MCPSVRPSLRFIIRELCSGFPLVHPSYPLCEPCSELSTALRAFLHPWNFCPGVPICEAISPDYPSVRFAPEHIPLLCPALRAFLRHRGNFVPVLIIYFNC